MKIVFLYIYIFCNLESNALRAFLLVCMNIRGTIILKRYENVTFKCSLNICIFKECIFLIMQI